MGRGKVSSVADEDARQLHRESKALKREKMIDYSRISGLLVQQGILLQHLEILIKSDRLSVLHLWQKVFNGFRCDIDKVAKRFIIVG